MEINQQNFQDICVLYQNGFEIIGRTSRGVVLQYSTATANDASCAILIGCKLCSATNCNAQAEDTDPAEIYAKIS